VKERPPTLLEAAGVQPAPKQPSVTPAYSVRLSAAAIAEALWRTSATVASLGISELVRTTSPSSRRARFACGIASRVTRSCSIRANVRGSDESTWMSNAPLFAVTVPGDLWALELRTSGEPAASPTSGLVTGEGLDLNGGERLDSMADERSDLVRGRPRSTRVPMSPILSGPSGGAARTGGATKAAIAQAQKRAARPPARPFIRLCNATRTTALLSPQRGDATQE